jgi:hypothetical protein
MTGAECEKENSGSSWGIGRTQPNIASACGTFTGSGYHTDTSVGDTDRLCGFV